MYFFYCLCYVYLPISNKENWKKKKEKSFLFPNREAIQRKIISYKEKPVILRNGDVL